MPRRRIAYTIAHIASFSIAADPGYLKPKGRSGLSVADVEFVQPCRFKLQPRLKRMPVQEEVGMNAGIASGTMFLTTLILVASASPGRLEASMLASDRTVEIVEQELLKNALKIDVKDSGASDFPRDFEIKVTNLSDKPVYHIEVMVEFPEVKQLRGTAFGLPLRFGDPELTDVARLAKSGQASIMPGESVVLRPTHRQIEDYSKDLTGLFASRGKSLDQIRISFQSISHGDGTGYLIGIPYPQKNNQSVQKSVREGNSKVRRSFFSLLSNSAFPTSLSRLA